MKNKKAIKKFYKDNSVLYKVSFSLMGHRVRKQPFNTIGEASAYVDRVRYLIISGQYEEYIKAETEALITPTFLEAYKRCTRSRSWNIEPSTKLTYKSVLVNWFFNHIGDVRIADINKRHLQKIKADMVQKGISQLTMSTYFTAYYSVMKMGVQFGHIETYPTIKNNHDTRMDRLYVSPKMLREIVSELRNMGKTYEWISAYVMCQFYLVARSGEVLALTWDDIDFENMTVSITKHVYQGQVIQGTKNKQTNNAYPLHPELVPFLKEQRLRTGQARFVFPAPSYYKKTNKDKTRSKPQYHASLIRRALKMVSKALNINGRLTTHAFRRGAADYMLRQGMTIHQVAFAMRTTHINVLRSYSTVNEKHFVKVYLDQFTTKGNSGNAQNAEELPTRESRESAESDKN